ncbi:MAG TPA: hypothetical protein VGC17_02340 [Lactovum miscens]|uniref:beta strand repeat-containing protein n=1 Tax=Lactovum miscens TaxID=190387 RepID=UPI002ED95DCA
MKYKKVVHSLLAFLAMCLLIHAPTLVKADFSSATAFPTASSGGGGSSFSISQLTIKQAAFYYHHINDSAQDIANENTWLAQAGVSAPDYGKFVVLQWYSVAGVGNFPIKYLSVVTGSSGISTEFHTTQATVNSSSGFTWAKMKSLSGAQDEINTFNGSGYGLASGPNNSYYGAPINGALNFSGYYSLYAGPTAGQNLFGGSILWQGNQIIQNLVANASLDVPVQGTPSAKPTGISLQKTATDATNGQTTATEETTKSANDTIDYSIKFGFANALSHAYNSTAKYHDSSNTAYDITTTEQAFQSVTTITDNLPAGFVINASNPITITTTDGNKVNLTSNSIPSITTNMTYNASNDYAYYKVNGQTITITYVSGDHPSNSQSPSTLNIGTAVIHGKLDPSLLPSSDPSKPNANFDLTSGVGSISNSASSSEVVQEFDRSASTSNTTSQALLNTSSVPWGNPNGTTTTATSNTVKLDIQAHRVYGNYFKDTVNYANNSLSYSPTGNPLGTIAQSDGTLASAFASHWIYPGLTVNFSVPSSQQVTNTVSPTYDLNIPGVVQTTNGASLSYSNSSNTVVSGGQETVTDPTYIYTPGQKVQDIEWNPAKPLTDSGATTYTMTGAGLTLGNWGYNSTTTAVYANFDAAASRKIPISAVSGGKTLVNWGGAPYSPRSNQTITIAGTAGYYDADGFLGDPVSVTFTLTTTGQLSLSSAIPTGSTAISLFGVSLKWTVGQDPINTTTWKDNFPGGTLSGSAFGSNYTIGWSVAHGTATNSNSVETITVNGGWAAGSSPSVGAGGGGHLDSNAGNYSGWVYPNFSGTWVLYNYAVTNNGLVWGSNTDYSVSWAGNPITIAPGYYENASPVRLTIGTNGLLNLGSGADPNAPLLTFGGYSHVTQLIGGTNYLGPNQAVQTSSLSYTMYHNFWTQVGVTVPGLPTIALSAVNTGGYAQSTYTTSGSYTYQDGSDTWTGGTVVTTPGQSVEIPNTQSTTDKILSPNVILNSSMYTSTWYHNVKDIAGNTQSFDHLTNLQTGKDEPITITNGTYSYTMPDFDGVISMYYGQKAELVNVNHYTDSTNADASLWNKSFDNNEVPGTLATRDSISNIYTGKAPKQEAYLLYEGQDFANSDNSGLGYTPSVASIYQTPSVGSANLWKLVPALNQTTNFGFNSGSSPKVVTGNYTTNVLTLQYQTAAAALDKAAVTINADQITIDTADASSGLPFKLNLTGKANEMLLNLIRSKTPGFSLDNYNYRIDILDQDFNVAYSKVMTPNSAMDSSGNFTQTLAGNLKTFGSGTGNGAKINYNVVITPLPNGSLPNIDYFAPLSTDSESVPQTVTTDTVKDMFKTHGFTASHLVITNNKPLPTNLSVVETVATPSNVQEYHEYFGMNFPTEKINTLSGYGINGSYPYYYGYDTGAQNSTSWTKANAIQFNLAYPTGLNDDQTLLKVPTSDNQSVTLSNSQLTNQNLTTTAGTSQITNGFNFAYSNAELPAVAVNKYNGKVYSYQTGSSAWKDADTPADAYTNQGHMMYLPTFISSLPKSYSLKLTSNSFGVNHFTVAMNEPINIYGQMFASLDSKTSKYDALWWQGVITTDPFDYSKTGKLPNGILEQDITWLKENNLDSSNPWWKK